MSTTRTTVMADGGEYSQHNAQGYATADRVKPYVLNAVKHALINAKGDTAFSYCDFGAADGGMASVLAQVVIEKLRAMESDAGEPAKDINLIFEDQAENDFSPILSNFQREVRQASDSVFVSVVGESFYRQCLPRESLDVGVSFTSAHWLNVASEEVDGDLYEQVKYAFWACSYTELRRRQPAIIPNNRRQYDDLSTTNILRDKAAADWERFLLMRAKELKNGGLLVMAIICRSTTSGDQELDAAWLSLVSSFVLGYLAVIHELVEEGIMTEKEQSSVAFPAYARTEKELRQPFEDDSSPVRRAGLKLVQFEPVYVACPNEQLYKSGAISKAEFGKKSALSIRTWSYQLTYNALSQERSKEERREIVDLVYSRLAENLGRDEKLSTLPYPMAFMVVQKNFGSMVHDNEE